MKTEKVNVADLMLDPSNVRKHSAANLNAIKASLAKFGQQKPIVVDSKGIVIAGNGQLMAAKQLGWSTIEVVRTELTGSDATAYAIAGNRTAELAEWDEAALAAQLAALKVEDGTLLQAAWDYEEVIASLTGDEEAIEGKQEVRNAKVVRQIVLVFLQDEYEAVLSAFDRYSEQHGLHNSSEVVIHILEQNGHAITQRS